MNKIIINKSEEKLITIIWSGQETKIDYDIYLNKEGAGIKFLMLLLGQKENSVIINVNIYHQKPQTNSKVIVKGVLNDLSKVDFNGLVKIEKNSKLSNAWLAAHLLLISDKAKGRAVPSLEILENDIKAGHATTVGRVNELEIFYLMSRGLSRKKAKQFIIEGFLSGFLENFENNKEKQNLINNFKYAV
jgi:Fe-S cluster assembly protein SufD